MESPEIIEITKKIDEKDVEPRDMRQGYSDTIKIKKEIMDPTKTQYRPIWHKIFDPRETQYQQTCHKIFLLCCIVAASLDPLFFYIPIINDKKKCLAMDEKLKKTMLVLRSVMDLTYIFHIVFQIFSGYLAYTSESKSKQFFFPSRMGMIRRIKWWIIIIDIICVLPILQVVILVYFFKMKGSESLNVRKFINFFVFVQLVPRVFRIYMSGKELTKNLSLCKIGEAAWVKGLFNFFLYIIASHVVGAFWYFFSLQRESECWQHACKGNSTCSQSTFFCDIRYHIVHDPVVDYLNHSCPLIQPFRFDFGMFAPALQSGIVNSMDFPKKFFYCFAWGLRNLSSFGSNLQTSTYFWESLFSAAITIIGLLLFIYLIGNLQIYLQFSAKDSEKSRRKMEKSMRKMRIKELDIDIWIKSNKIPSDMRKEIVDRFCEKMLENEDVNLKNLLSILPTQSKNRIKQSLCLPILKKVALLQGMADKSFHEIFIDHLKPVIFNEHSEIFREGDLLDQMLFFTQGSAWAYSTVCTNPVKLERGDFYGEELLEWALTSSPFPYSHKTLKTKTKVEAFVFRAHDLESLVSKNWWRFRKELGHCPKFRQKWDPAAAAAITVQAAWQRRKKVLGFPVRGQRFRCPLVGQLIGDPMRIALKRANKGSSESSRV